jgi:hypothetical protein
MSSKLSTAETGAFAVTELLQGPASDVGGGTEPDAPEAQVGASMDIHKPKPWHGWREFLKEYGIIVLGVLTALALEQAVDALRWAHEVGEAREALGREITYNVKALKLMDLENPCIAARLDQLQRWAEGAGPRPGDAIRRPTLFALSIANWDVVNSGQIVAHFPLDQQIRFAQAYASFENERDAVADERAAWANLAAIASDAQLDDTDRRELRRAVALARSTDGRRRGNAVIMERRDAPLMFDGPGPDVLLGSTSADPEAFCRPVGPASAR